MEDGGLISFGASPLEPHLSKARIKVRSVNLRVAASAFTAGLETQATVGHAVLPVEASVTLQAQLTPFAPHQKMRVGAAVRGVAGGAAFHLHRRMLVEVRAHASRRGS